MLDNNGINVIDRLERFANPPNLLQLSGNRVASVEKPAVPIAQQLSGIDRWKLLEDIIDDLRIDFTLGLDEGDVFFLRAGLL